MKREASLHRESAAAPLGKTPKDCLRQAAFLLDHARDQRLSDNIVPAVGFLAKKTASPQISLSRVDVATGTSTYL